MTTKFYVQGPDGKDIEVDMPDNATDEQIQQAAAYKYYSKKPATKLSKAVLQPFEMGDVVLGSLLKGSKTGQELAQTSKEVGAGVVGRGAELVSRPVAAVGNILGLTDKTGTQTGRDIKENIAARYGVLPTSEAFKAGEVMADVGAGFAVNPVVGGIVKGAGVLANAPKLTKFGQYMADVGPYTFTKGAGALEKLGEFGGQTLAKGVTGGLGGYFINPEAESAGVGAAANIALPSILNQAGNVANYIRRAGGNVIRPFLPGGAERSAGRLAREISGDKTDDIIALLKQAPRGVTAGQAAVPAGSAEWSAAQDIMKTVRPSEYEAVQAAQEANRLRQLQNVTPNKAVAERLRSEVTGPLYKEAEQTIVPLDEELTNILKRAPRGTISSAKDIARMEDRPFVMGSYKPPTETKNALMGTTTTAEEFPEISGAALHDIKRAISDKAFGPQAVTGAGRDTQAATRTMLDDYIKTIENRIPAYGEARSAYAELSRPVNQAEILGRARQVLEGNTVGERAGPFMNVLGSGEQALLKKITGAPRYSSLEEALEPNQLAAMKSIGRELERDATESNLARAGAARAREEIYKWGDQISTPQFLDRAWVIAKSLIRGFEGVGTKRTVNSLSELMMDPQKLALVMEKATPADRQILQKAMKLVPAATYGGIGAANE